MFHRNVASTLLFKPFDVRTHQMKRISYANFQWKEERNCLPLESDWIQLHFERVERENFDSQMWYFFVIESYHEIIGNNFSKFFLNLKISKNLLGSKLKKIGSGLELHLQFDYLIPIAKASTDIIINLCATPPQQIIIFDQWCESVIM